MAATYPANPKEKNIAEHIEKHIEKIRLN